MHWPQRMRMSPCQPQVSRATGQYAAIRDQQWVAEGAFDKEVWPWKSGYVVIWPRDGPCGRAGGKVEDQVDTRSPSTRREKGRERRKVEPSPRSVQLPADPRSGVFRREGSPLVTSGETAASWAARVEVPEHKLSDGAGCRAGLRRARSQSRFAGDGQRGYRGEEFGCAPAQGCVLRLGLLGLPWAVLVLRPFLLKRSASPRGRWACHLDTGRKQWAGALGTCLDGGSGGVCSLTWQLRRLEVGTS